MMRKQISVKGSFLRNIAKCLVNQVDDFNFTASESWLEKFNFLIVKKRLQIVACQNLKQISLKPQANINETRLFSKAVPTKSLVKDDKNISHRKINFIIGLFVRG